MKTLRLFVLTFALLVFTPIVYAQDYDFYLQKARERIAEGDCDGAQRSYNVYKEVAKKTNKEIEQQIENCQGVIEPKNNGVLLYSQIPEFYCDGIYEWYEAKDKNGHALHTPDLDYNSDHFRITFSFMALSELGKYFWGTKNEFHDDYQWVIIQGVGTRRLGLCLKSDRSILITTNNQENFYQTNLTYSLGDYMSIDIEYDHGLLKINKNSLYVEMDKDYQYDKGFHSVNYSRGNAFYGYIKDLKIYSYPD